MQYAVTKLLFYSFILIAKFHGNPTKSGVELSEARVQLNVSLGVATAGLE